MKKIISMLLAAVMVFGILPVTSFATTSDMNVIEQDSWYSILLPENASDELQNAAEEMNLFLDEITGITLPVVTDNGSMTADGCYVSFGNTSVFAESGYSADGLEAEASAVKTYGDSILLYGGSDVGVTYAMYELLEHWFDLKFYTPDSYTYTVKETVAFEELDIASTPAVDYRTVGSYLTWHTSWTNRRRMRVSNAEEYMDTLGHSFFKLMPPSTYYADHPEWYSNYEAGSNDNWQLCLSNADMRAQLLANVKAKLAQNSDIKYFAIVQNDGGGFCTCDNCKALNLNYSSSDSKYAGAHLAMVNEIADACAEDYPDVIFYMAAYTSATAEPPTKNITAAPNVGVMYAPIDGNRTYSYFGNSGTSDYTNGMATTIIDGWDAICDHLMLWGYNAQFGDAMVPINSYDSLANNAAGYAEYGFEVVFEQGHGKVLPYFETLRNYLAAKALYDGSIDTFTEIDNFINVYYGPAADAVGNYFDAHLANLRAFEAKGNAYKSWAASQYLNGTYRYSPAIIADNYSKSYVDTCAGYFDTAYAALADAYCTDSAEYATYKKRLDLEYLGVLYLYLELYADQLTQEQGAQMAQDVFRIVNEQSVTAISNEKINAWRTAFNVVPDGVDYTFFEVTNQDRDCAFSSYSGTVGGEDIDGIRVTSYAYQPHFKFTEEGIALIQAYAEANGYDMLKINAYANLYNNAFVINSMEWIYDAWESVSVSVDDLTTDFDFWSQSEGNTEIYMTFEFYTAGVITAGSFSGSNFAFNDFYGTIADVTFSGVKATSSAYQPGFTFSETGIAEIQAYAEENGFDTLAIYTYSEVYNNNVQVGGSGTQNKMWMLSYADIETLSTSYTFRSLSEGATTIYLRFAFINAPVIDKTSFDASNFKVYGYGGVIGGMQVDGIYLTSGNYQPHFKFTADAIASIQAYAEANGYDMLKISAYANLYNNAFVVNNLEWIYTAWESVNVSVDDLTTDFDFWSQSEGASNIYMTFEFYSSGSANVPIVNQSYFTGDDFTFKNYEGVVGEEEILGVEVKSGAYQPRFYFTEEGVEAIKAYAAENGYNMLKISAYANLYNNAFVINNMEWIYAAWESVSVSVDDLTTDFEFWSQSEGNTEIYMTFEFYTEATISTGSFSGSNFTFENYEGTIADVTFTGFKATSSAYQPSFTFSETGIAKIQAYAEANGFDTLAIYTYSEVYNNNVQVGGSGTQNKMWMLSYADIETLSTSYTFKSNSEGATTIYLRFEFVNAPVVDKTSFSGTGYKIYGYGGVVGGEQITGIFATSSNYQPSFYFTADAITAIQAYAAENDYNTLTIHSYADLYNNGFKLGDTYTGQDAWYATDFDIASLSTSLRFLSQSEGATNVYMWFEFSYQPTITTSSFSGSNFAFENYEGTIADVTFSGIKATSSAYQPSFTFSETGIAKIQAYAQENGFDTLAIYTYSEVYNNNVQVGGSGTQNKMWMLSYADIETLSTSYTFKSNSEGATTIYLRFEFVNAPVVDKTSFSGTGYKIYGYGGVVGGEQITGIFATSSNYQPSFYFTADAITAIQAYAAENDYNTLTIHSYADLYNNGFKLGDTYTKQDAWYATDFDIASLSTSLRFLSQSEGTTNVYMWFEFSKQDAITTSSFNGSNFAFENYEGTIADVTFTGFKATSSAYQPSFTFSETGIAKIQAYAEANGFDTLAIYTYSEVYNNNVQVGGLGTQNKMWMLSYADIATLSTSYTIRSLSEGATTIYLRFEFVNAPVVDKTSFSGTGYKIYGYGGVVGGEQINGIFATSGNYQPSFYFTADAIAKIQAYAAENDYNTLTIHSYADLYNNGFKLGDTYTKQDAWHATDFDIASLSTSLRFLSQSEGTTNVYMWFEFSHVCKYGDWVVTTPATLTTAGERQKTCSCGDVITEVIPCLAGDVESWGLTLGGDLSVNFMISIHEDIRETAKIVITVAGDANEYAVADLSANPDNGLYYVSINVAAAQMNDTITVQIVNGEDASVTKEYTVANYAKIILANESYSAYHQIVKEMLNYGDAAQTYFGYNVDNRTDVNLDGVGTVEIPADAAADMAVSGKVDGISFYGASLLFRNKIAVRYYFTVTGDISSYTFTANGTECEPVLKDGMYYIEVADINPQDLDDVITVIVNDTLSVSYSPMNYIVRMSTKGSENLQALMKALYNYHLAAENLIPDAQ